MLEKKSSTQPRNEEGILFLCVANSARSQMAEGLARARCDSRMVIQSAGSQPGSVNPFAVAVLAEVGIDIRAQRSKHVDTIDPVTVGTVVTLCAEEVCPAYPHQVTRFSWSLPDPAGLGGTDEEQLGRFRVIRDEITRRLDDLPVLSLQGDAPAAAPRLTGA